MKNRRNRKYLRVRKMINRVQKNFEKLYKAQFKMPFKTEITSYGFEER